MKLENPIEVDLFKFIVNGEFDYIKPGQTKEWILNNFPDPDCINDYKGKTSIWQYGNFEFHFDERNFLFFIWCDNFHKLSAGDNIVLNKWLLKKTTVHSLRLPRVIKLLNQNKISFTLTHDEKIDTVVIRILKSGVSLYFGVKDRYVYLRWIHKIIWIDRKDYKDRDDAMFILHGFGLSRED